MATSTATTPHTPTAELDFDDIFRKLLEASNLVQRLREIDAEPALRIEAQSNLLNARIDASHARSRLN